MDNYVGARIVRSDGAEFSADGADWLLTKINGASSPGYELFTEKNGSGDGDTVTGKRVKSRELELEATCLDPSVNDILRRQALAFFNPKYTYKVYLSYMGTTHWLEAELSSHDVPNRKLRQPQTWSAYFLAAEPYWQSVDDFGQDIAAETPRWGFPYMDHPARGTLVSVYNFEREVVFEYDGDAPASPTITLTADGDVTNPKLVRDGAFVRLIDTLTAGDTVVITTAPRAIGVTKNGANVLNRIDRASDFTALRLVPGMNRVRYEADYGDNHLHAVIRYTKQYLGV